MNIKKLILPILLIAFGCKGIYEFDTDMYKRKIVVESLINPDSVIKVTVAWNRPTNATYIRSVHTPPIEYINGALVQIEENGILILSGTTVNGVLFSDVYPVAGKRYRLTVKVESEIELTAATSIPFPADISYSIRKKYDNRCLCSYIGIFDECIEITPFYELSYIAVDVNDIVLPPEVQAVWITGYAKFDNDTFPYIGGDLYSNSPYIDQFNVAGEDMDVLLRESNILYERGVIRIQRQAISLALPFTFSKGVSGARRNEWDEEYGEWKYFYNDGRFLLHITSPSNEYDRYRRSAIKQSLIWGWLFSSDPVSVFSNINNGVGIFAGYNTTVVAAPIKYNSNTK